MSSKRSIVPFLGTATLLIYSVFHHAMWRDELQAWLVVRESPSLLDLIQNLKYDYHPSAWYFFLWGLQQLSTHPVSLQIAHLCLALMSLAMIFFLSPFNRSQKLLLGLSYYLCFEYAVIARSYALGVLLAFSYVILTRRPREDFVLRTVILGVLANTTVYGFFLSAGLSLREYLSQIESPGRFFSPLTNPRTWIGIMILLFFWALSFLTMKDTPNPNEAGVLSNWFLHFDPIRLRNLSDVFLYSFFPLPVPKVTEWWNSLWIKEIGPTYAFFAILTVVFCLYQVLKQMKKGALAVFLTTLIMVLLFTYTRLYGTQRHLGILFVTFVTTTWLALWEQPELQSNKKWRTALSILLIPSAIAGLSSHLLHSLKPFSASREASEWIKAHHLEGYFILADHSFLVSPVAGYLDRPVYYLSTQRIERFFRYRNSPTPKARPLLETAKELSRTTPQLLLVLNYPIEKEGHDPSQVQELARFENSAGDENFYIYQLKDESQGSNSDPNDA